MTVFTRTWNAAYEASPPNSQFASQGAERIREVKIDTAERLVVDHSWAGDADDGEHKKVTFHEQGGAPTNITDTVIFYALDSGGEPEIFVKKEGGTAFQLTKANNLALIDTQTQWTAGQGTQEIALTDAATVVVDADLSNSFRVTLAGNRTLGAPSGGNIGQVISIRIIQDGTGGRTLSFGNYFGSLADDLTLSTGASDQDLVTLYRGTSQWHVLGLKKDMSNNLP